MVENLLTDDPLDGIWDTMPVSDDPEEHLLWLKNLTKVQQVLYPTHYLCAEVYNGGFHQYFTNTTGVDAPEAVAGFNELGLSDISAIVKEAIAFFDDPYPRKRALREVVLDSVESPFSALDDKFYSCIAIPGAPPLHEEDRFTLAAKEFVKRFR